MTHDMERKEAIIEAIDKEVRNFRRYGGHGYRDDLLYLLLKSVLFLLRAL